MNAFNPFESVQNYLESQGYSKSEATKAAADVMNKVFADIDQPTTLVCDGSAKRPNRRREWELFFAE